MAPKVHHNRKYDCSSSGSGSLVTKLLLILMCCARVLTVQTSPKPTHEYRNAISSICRNSPDIWNLSVVTTERSMLIPYSIGAIQSMKRNFKLISSATHPRPNCVLVTCMLLLGGDIESNTGPIKFPCTMCGKPVAENQHALACDVCEKWSHIKCNGVSHEVYRQLQHLE